MPHASERRSVVVTGLGPISPNGTGIQDFWEGLLTSRSGIGTITAFDASEYTSRIAGEVDEFDLTTYGVGAREAARMDRFTQFGVAASLLAVEDGGLDISSLDTTRMGVYIGSGIGGLGTLEAQHKVLLERGPRRVTPFLIPMMISNLAAGQVSIELGIKGPSICLATACATGSHAIGEALEAIVRGDIDVALAGGTEAAVTPLSMAGFCSLKALSTRNDEPTRASRPFDLERDGFVLGEGAGVVLIESEEHARARGARIYAALIGYGSTADAYHITSPAPGGDGARRAMEGALRSAGLATTDIDYINAHGTSTKLNDSLETTAIKALFGDDAYRLKISSTKSTTGHLLGAAGGLEAIVCAKTISEGVIPPTANLENPDPECDLDYVPGGPLKHKVRAALSNSLAFGGQNATLAFKEVDRG